jgi:EAL and modified HD-GYP domain-containing signal transduction protein
MTVKHPVLAQLALGYAPLYDKQRQVMGTRLSLLPLKPDAELPAAAVLAAVLEGLPPEHKPGVLGLPQEAALNALLGAGVPPHLALELPAFLAAGMTLEGLKGQLLKGASNAPLASRGAFKATELDLDDLRRGIKDPNGLPLWCNAVRSAPEADEAFQRGAVAVFGLPVDGSYEPPPGKTVKSEITADLSVIVELMSQVDKELPLDPHGGDAQARRLAELQAAALPQQRRLRPAGRGDQLPPRHDAAGLPASEALAGLAAHHRQQGQRHAPRHVGRAAPRLVMEELSKALQTARPKDEMFICGLFSLLDHLLKTPFAQLLQAIPMPERVRQALVEGSGPYAPYLGLVRAMESESAFDFKDACEALMLGPTEANQALLTALAKGAQLD